MNKTSKISIIVPVYNSELYLKQCLESLVNQTYKEIEIICVNDGSTDSSQEIISLYMELDSRIILINKENSGVSDTRNVGIQKALGDYIIFVDSDDWLEENTCEIAINCAIENQADVVIWSYISEGNNVSKHKSIFPNDVLFHEEEVKNYLLRRYVGLVGDELYHPELLDSLAPVWGKLYRRSVIVENKIAFVDLAHIGTYEDGIFNLEVFPYVKKAFYVNRCLYHYRRGERNSVTSGYNKNLFAQWENLFLYMQRYITENHLEEVFLNALDNRRALSLVGLTLNIIRSNESIFCKQKLLKQIIMTDSYKGAYKKLDISYFPIWWKVFYLCAKYHCATGVLLLGMAIEKIINR